MKLSNYKTSQKRVDEEHSSGYLNQPYEAFLTTMIRSHLIISRTKKEEV